MLYDDNDEFAHVQN